MFKWPLGDCDSNENNTYVGLTTTTLSKQFAIHFIDSSFIALYLKTHSIPKSKFRKILVKNSTIIAHEINKLRKQILEAQHMKTKKNQLKSIELTLKIVTMFWSAFISLFSKFLDNILFPLIGFCFLTPSASQFYPTLRLRNFVMLWNKLKTLSKTFFIHASNPWWWPMKCLKALGTILVNLSANSNQKPRLLSGNLKIL